MTLAASKPVAPQGAGLSELGQIRQRSARAHSEHLDANSRGKVIRGRWGRSAMVAVGRSRLRPMTLLYFGAVPTFRFSG
jgi:hypothetical protein